jgi:hypothetical protein
MGRGPLDRRAFLRLAARGRDRVLEISCERLHLRWVDAPPRLTPAVLAELMEESGWADRPGEPPTRVDLETREELLQQLDATLAGARVVLLIEPEWLADEDLRREVDARLAAFRRRGGRVASTSGPPAPPHSRSLAFAILLAALSAAPVAAQSGPVDEDLRMRVQAAIAAAADLPADSIEVQVLRGVVTLTGSVLCDGCGGNATPGGAGTVQQSLGAVVRAVPGVADVRFRLRYRPPA